MEAPKIFVKYLPQYHETPHNNEWWGVGFTDWYAVKQGESLFEGHKQPIVPLNGEYYDLLNKTTMERQANLAKEYGIDGFIFYHYYFGNNRMELERPAENLLKWHDIDMPFCFSWANESWTRTWSKFTGNVWGEKIENKMKTDESDGILVKQVYGDEKEWEQHFFYLLPFFRDNRYIKIDGKPLFFIFDASVIGCLSQMISFWRRLASESGLKGLYLVGNKLLTNDVGFDAVKTNEPGDSIGNLRRRELVNTINGVGCCDYKEIWDSVIDSFPFPGEKTFFECPVGYDTTLRRGKNGTCIINRTPEIFKNGIIRLLKKSAWFKNEFIIINAWNEWGEGMYLEPDEVDKYSYLEAVRDAKNSVSSVNLIDIQLDNGYSERQNEYLAYQSSKYRGFYFIYRLWLDLLEKKAIIFRPVLEKKNINSIAIYGYGEMGKRVERQLKKEGIEVLYAIDRTVFYYGDQMQIYRPDEDLPMVDCIIVTSSEVSIVRNVLLKKCHYSVYSLYELLQMSNEDNI